MRTTILMVAGEASADAHGRDVLQALWAQAPQLEVFGVGGAQMRAAGLQAIYHAEDIAVAGLTEVFWAVPRLWRMLRHLSHLAAQRRPAVALLLDLPDFNLRLARRLKRLGIPVVYYISPQIWAWRRRRVKQIRRDVAQMLVILPFEVDFYRQQGVPVRFVGHPLIEQLPEAGDQRQARQSLGLAAASGLGPWVALLPGSRQGEVRRHLPVMLAGLDLLRQRFPQLQALLPLASTVPAQLVQPLLQGVQTPVRLLAGQAAAALQAADVAVVCSGTATLQAALLERAMVVVYRVSWLSYQILRRLVRVPHIALVNLIAGQRLVPELLQRALTPDNLRQQLLDLLARYPTSAASQQDSLAQLRQLLGSSKPAAQVAQVLLGYVLPQSLPGESAASILPPAAPAPHPPQLSEEKTDTHASHA